MWAVLDCYDSTLVSGPPHKYNDKEYGPRKKVGKYVRIGDTVGVVMDVPKGELSFVLNRVILMLPTIKFRWISLWCLVSSFGTPAIP